MAAQRDVFWEYYARPGDDNYIQEGTVTTGPRGRFRLLFRDFNLGRHKMCFAQIDTRFQGRECPASRRAAVPRVQALPRLRHGLLSYQFCVEVPSAALATTNELSLFE